MRSVENCLRSVPELLMTHRTSAACPPGWKEDHPGKQANGEGLSQRHLNPPVPGARQMAGAIPARVALVRVPER